jgi:cell wall-associated NlpC family hydrolase
MPNISNEFLGKSKPYSKRKNPRVENHVALYLKAVSSIQASGEQIEIIVLTKSLELTDLNTKLLVLLSALD